MDAMPFRPRHRQVCGEVDRLECTHECVLPPPFPRQSHTAHGVALAPQPGVASSFATVVLSVVKAMHKAAARKQSSGTLPHRYCGLPGQSMYRTPAPFVARLRLHCSSAGRRLTSNRGSTASLHAPDAPGPGQPARHGEPSGAPAPAVAPRASLPRQPVLRMGSEVATAAYGGLVAIPAVWGIGKVRTTASVHLSSYSSCASPRLIDVFSLCACARCGSCPTGHSQLPAGGGCVHRHWDQRRRPP